MSAEKLLTLIESVRSLREVLRSLDGGHGVRVSHYTANGKVRKISHDDRAEQISKARSAVAMAESALREESKRLGIFVTVLEPEAERRGQQVCARTLPGYQTSEE